MRDLFFAVAIGLLVSARLASAACTLTETTGATFSQPDSGSSQVASLSVTCDSAYQLALDGGSHASGSRRLQDSKENFISYRLWQDKSAAQEWGDNGASYAASPLNAPAGSNIHPVFGSLSDAASAAAGSYSDTVRVTLSWPPYGTADQQSAILSVALHVTETCSLDVSGIHGFGTWPTGGANLSGVALGSVSITCSPDIQYALGIDAGQHYDGSRRQLASGSNMVPYTLRTDNGREWGDTGLKAIISDYLETHHAQAVQGGGTGQSQNFFLWGDAEIAGAPDGSYADTATVTIAW